MAQGKRESQILASESDKIEKINRAEGELVLIKSADEFYLNYMWLKEC